MFTAELEKEGPKSPCKCLANLNQRSRVHYKEKVLSSFEKKKFWQKPNSRLYNTRPVEPPNFSCEGKS